MLALRKRAPYAVQQSLKVSVLDLRKLLAAALTSGSLKSDPDHEAAIDRVLAMAHADRLGTLLWRLRLANDRGSFAPAVAVLAHRLQRSLKKGAPQPLSMITKVAHCSLMEWLDDVCRRCWGRGHMVAKDSPVLTHVCTLCNGTGRGHHQDHARARALGLSVDVARKWEQRFAMAHAFIASADRSTWSEVATQLEHISRKSGVTTKTSPAQEAPLDRQGDLEPA